MNKREIENYLKREKDNRELADKVRARWREYAFERKKGAAERQIEKE